MNEEKETLGVSKTISPQYKYDAFISYSHSEPDAFIAQKLHSMLEHYRVPRKIKGLSREKIERIFRDKEELPLSSDLAANIQEALKQSEFLILICSPRSMKSKWVQKEVELFLETHTREKVLCIVADGEPQDVFPERIRFLEKTIIKKDGTQKVVKVAMEPMAADVRGKNRKEIVKRLKEEFLRILAPILSCSYDTLRQRHREYQFKKIISIVSGVAVLTMLFMIYAFRQTVLINEQYQEARRNQARYLSKISGDLLKEGNRKKALQMALAITPKDENSEEPVVPEQLYALNNALYSYQQDDKLNYDIIGNYELKGQIARINYKSSEAFSGDGTKLFCMDDLGNAYIVDLQTGKYIWKFTARDLNRKNAGKLLWFGAASEERAVAVFEREIYILDWKKKKIENVIRGDDAYGYRVSCTVTDEYIGIANGQMMWVYQMKDGSLKLKLEQKVCDMIFYDHNRVACVYEEFDVENGDGYRHFFALYQMDTGETEWMVEDPQGLCLSNAVNMNLCYMNINEKSERILAVSTGKRLTLLRADTGEVLQEREYKSEIIGVEQLDAERYLIALYDGALALADTRELLYKYEIEKMESNVLNMLYNPVQDCVVQTLGQSTQILYRKNTKDERMKPLSLERKIDAVDYATVELSPDKSKTYRIVFSENSDDGQVHNIDIYEVGTSKKVWEYQSNENTYYADDVIIKNIDGMICAVILDELGLNENYQKEYRITIADLESRKTLSVQTFTDEETLYISEWRSFHQDNKIILQSFDEFMIATLTKKGLQLDGTEVKVVLKDKLSKGSFEIEQITADDNYVIISEFNENENKLHVWDVESGWWKEIDGKSGLDVVSDSLVVGNESSKLAVYTEQGNIDIYDLEQGKRIQTLPVGYFENVKCQYMKQDKYLLVLGAGKYLSMWDVEKGTVCMQSTDNSVTWGNNIYTDKNEHYFALVFHGMIASETSITLGMTSIYYVDDQGKYYHYADVPPGVVNFENNEVFVYGNGGYYAPIYGYQELKKQAEEVLNGELLSDAEKRQYYISE